MTLNSFHEAIRLDLPGRTNSHPVIRTNGNTGPSRVGNIHRVEVRIDPLGTCKSKVLNNSKNEGVKKIRNHEKYTYGGGMPGGRPPNGGTTGGGTDKSGVKFFLLYSRRSAVMTWNKERASN